jgi:hypothetical protein
VRSAAGPDFQVSQVTGIGRQKKYIKVAENRIADG